MRDKLHSYRIAVRMPDDHIKYEDHKVLEKDTAFGDAVAAGRVVRFYENLKSSGKIKDFHIISE